MKAGWSSAETDSESDPAADSTLAGHEIPFEGSSPCSQESAIGQFSARWNQSAIYLISFLVLFSDLH
jgi:hypothetical protein